jgi:predicted MPP superfamily phosphohydrolase
MRMFFVILALMVVMDLAWWRCADGMLRPLRRARIWRSVLAVFMKLQLLLLTWTITARWVGPGFDQLTPTLLIGAVYLWHLLALPLILVAWIALGAVTMPIRLTRWLRRERVEHPAHHASAGEVVSAAADLALEPEMAVSPSRRQFLGAAFVAAPPVLTAGTVGFSFLTLDHFRVRPLTLSFAELPRDLDGLTIAHVTDVHAGRFVEERQLRKIVEETNKLRADVILMTGDLINSSFADLPSSLDAVRRMDARHGVYLCEGNHDLFDGPLEFDRQVRAAGVSLLVNENDFIHPHGFPVQLLGLRWGLRGMRRSGGDDEVLAVNVPELLAQRQPDAFPILLAHHPHAFDLAAKAGIPLTLSGHTHGGQLMFSGKVGFGPLMYRYWSGHYRKGNSSLIVSNGVGHWFPIRVNAPAEIVHITLRRA